MSDQQSKAVQQPLQPREQQLELERWALSTGGSRMLRGRWEAAASGTLAQRISTLYIKKLLEIWERSKHSPGRQAHVWDLLKDRNSVMHVALETLSFILVNMDEGESYNKLCYKIGHRAEYVLWLSDPIWQKSKHLEGLRLSSNGSLDMGLMRKRLRDKGFRKASGYKELARVERAALGAFFVECIAESTKMIETYMQLRRGGKRRKMVRYTELYWTFLKRWREVAVLFRPIHMPMVVPPRPWTAHDSGGFLSLRTTVSTVPWERWPEVSKHLQPAVIDSINILQRQVMQIDSLQAALAEACWNLGHQVGGLPSQHRLDEPVDQWYKEQGLGPTAYWQAFWDWKSDRRKDGARQRYINGLISQQKIEGADNIWFVWSMDHRGRLYCRSSQLNVQGPDHMRSQLRFAERSPIKGNEAAFAWSLGDAYGCKQDPTVRMAYLESMSDAIAAVGNDPLGTLPLWTEAKEPWRFVQLCRDWAGYRDDPGYTSGTIHWLDQTCSGWGHVACLTRNGTLAEYTNVTGNAPADLYGAIGQLVVDRLKWGYDNADVIGLTERSTNSSRWWLDRTIPRSLWKQILMPVIYGRTYLTLADTIKLYLREEVGNFLTEEGYRIVDLALLLATTANIVVGEALPEVRDMARWLSKLSSLQIDAGLQPYWFTPNGLAVECYSTDTGSDTIRLKLANRTIRLTLQESTGQISKRKSARKQVPNYIHSLDGAFLQRFVTHWETYGHPITTVHDCFGTTLGHVDTLRKELNDQWHRFYTTDHLMRHHRMVAGLVDEEVPLPPVVGTLNLNRIGENPYLFC